MAADALPALQELHAPPGWRAIEFISDLHLQAGEPATFEAWRGYLAGTSADAVFILGDLFETWVGDDVALAPGFAADCAAVLRAAARQRPVFFMHGNRDFPVLGFAGARWLLTHGDALCLGDTEYLQFRAQVRQPKWQRDFLALPLAQRREIARGLRAQSEAVKQSGQVYADVDTDAALRWLEAADAAVMIHGHTHRPADHALDERHRRIVLSDWDAAAHPPRMQVLRLSAAGPQRLPWP